MQQNYQTTKAPTLAVSYPDGKFGGSPWANPMNIIAQDGVSSTWGASMGGQSALLEASGFGIKLPPGAMIDGIQLNLVGTSFSAYINMGLNIEDSTWKFPNTLSGSYGGPKDKWGLSAITTADIENLVVTISSQDISGGDAYCTIDSLSVTVHWHIEFTSAPADVPTRVVYKTYSRDGKYLGELPNVTTPFAFSQDINTAGSTIELDCGKTIDQGFTVDDLHTQSNEVLQTQSGEALQATRSTLVIAKGSSDDEVMFKNSNRVKAYIYNYWYPNGKLMFSGQMNRISYKYGGNTTSIKVLILSDGLDMSNYIARGFPFTYTNDIVQTNQNGYVTASEAINVAGFQRYAQTFRTGASSTNLGVISLMMQGTATVTVELYDAPGGNFLGLATKTISSTSPTVEDFVFPQLINTPPNTDRFFAVFLGSKQTARIYRNTASVYANGTAYEAYYAGGGGGGGWQTMAGDLYFVTKSGTPTTTAVFTSKDPVSNIASDVMADYNSRGGYIKKRNFQATGLSLSYTFSMSSVFDVVRKVLELSPSNYYAYVDLGLSEMDILPMSTTADYTVVRGRDVHELDLSLSIEQVQNYMLFTGGEVSGSNLFRQYSDNSSVGYYGIRTGTKSDNRVLLAATANAIGTAFIAENAGEAQQTSVTVLNSTMDTTKLTPGKTIGFRNFGSFIDDMVLQIVRREFNLNSVTLTLGRLPVRLNDEMERINRELLNEQTQKNPTTPS